MADLSIQTDASTPSAPPLLHTLSRWFAPAAVTPTADLALLGYESALPWTLGDMPGADSSNAAY